MPPTNVELSKQVDDLTTRLEKLENAPTYSTPAPAASGPRLVDFETTDPLLGTPISGVGLVVEETDDGALVAPLNVQGIRLTPDELTDR